MLLVLVFYHCNRIQTRKPSIKYSNTQSSQSTLYRVRYCLYSMCAVPMKATRGPVSLRTE